jgi:hypothetical protein
VSRVARFEAFAGFPVRLADTALAVDPRLVPAGEWGPREVVRHLIAVESEVWASRFAQVSRSDDPHWGWTEPGLAADLVGEPLTAVLSAFADARAATAATIATLDEAGWGRSGTHATYGRLDVEGLLRVAIEHDESHLGGLGAQRTE